MKLKKYFIMVVFVVTCVMTSISALSAQDEDLDSLLDRLSERIDSYPEMENWREIVLTRQIFTDKKWNPTDTGLTIKSMVTVIDGESELETLEITGTENGMSKDLSQEFNKDQDAEPESDKFKKEIGQEQLKMEDVEGGTFKKENMAKYDFKKLDDSVIDGRPVYVIETKAKKKDKSRLEGKYYIDQETFDILKFHGKPSKDPSVFVNIIEVEFEFEMLPEGYFVQKRSMTRSSMGILGMRLRMIMEVEHSDYEILPPDNTGSDMAGGPNPVAELSSDSTFCD